MHPIYTCTQILQECTYQTHMHIHTCPHTPHIPHRCVHSPHTYMHTMLVQASLPGAWPKVTTSGRMGKVTGSFPNASTTPTCRKGPRGDPSDQIYDERKCRFGGWQLEWELQWALLTNSVSRPVFVVCGAEISQGQWGGDWCHPGRDG